MPQAKTVTALAAALVCALLLNAAPALGAEPAPDITWTPYAKAKDAAQDSGKSLYVYFFTNWCGYCKRMEAKTFTDPDVRRYLDENYVAARLNGDENQTIASTYGVRGYPTHIFRYNGEKSASVLPGYVEAADFLLILKYIHTGAFKDMTFPDFAAQQEAGGAAPAEEPGQEPATEPSE